MYYETESPIENDVEAIAFKIGAIASDVRLILAHFFFLHDDGLWHQSRCDKEILAYRAKSKKCKDSANARWSNANAMRSHTERKADALFFDANQEPRTNNHTITDVIVGGDKSPPPKRASQLSDDWEPKDSHHKLARSEGKDINRESAQFRDHHKARGNTFKNWDLAFNTWLRNNYGSKPQSKAAQMNQLITNTHEKDYGVGGKFGGACK
jgi:uncharacterized protein YdaU (DUF1376 family)